MNTDPKHGWELSSLEDYLGVIYFSSDTVTGFFLKVGCHAQLLPENPHWTGQKELQGNLALHFSSFVVA